MLKKYAITGEVLLGFIQESGHGEQFDSILDSNFFLECDGSTIWATYIPDNKRYESTTFASAIDHYLKTGNIKEIS